MSIDKITTSCNNIGAPSHQYRQVIVVFYDTCSISFENDKNALMIRRGC